MYHLSCGDRFQYFVGLHEAEKDICIPSLPAVSQTLALFISRGSLLGRPDRPPEARGFGYPFCIMPVLRLFALAVVFIAGQISPSSAAVIPAASISENHPIATPHIRAIDTVHHALPGPSSVAGVVDAIRLAFQAERRDAVQLPQHVRLESYEGTEPMADTTAGNQIEYNHGKRKDRISFFEPRVKVVAFEEQKGPAGADGSDRGLATEYLSQPLQGTEQRDTEVIRRAEKESAEAKQFMYAENMTRQHNVPSGVGREANSGESVEQLPRAENGALSPIGSQELPQNDPNAISQTDSQKRQPVEIPTFPVAQNEPPVAPSFEPDSVAGTEEVSEKAGGESQNVLGSIGSFFKSVIGKITGAKPESPKIPDAERSLDSGSKASGEEVRAVVNEIIKQVQLRTADEFKEHKEFLEREKILDSNGRLAVRPVMEFVQRYVVFCA